MAGHEGLLAPDWVRAAVGADRVRAELLRRWSLSEVWRVVVDPPVGEAYSVIVKRGRGEMAAEAGIYRDLVVPLALPSPRFDAVRSASSDAIDRSGEAVALVLEDVGSHTLEQRPSAEGYREAVRTLARMRAAAARGLAEDPSAGAAHRRGPADFVTTADRALVGLRALRPGLAGTLDGAASTVGALLGPMEARFADTVVHGDFQAKNLVHGERGTLVPVDWAQSYVHPHLGDLYTLGREARRQSAPGVSDGLAELYARESGTDPRVVHWLMNVGGLCWTLTALRWLVEEGAHAVPGAAGWIDEVAAEAGAQLRTLA